MFDEPRSHDPRPNAEERAWMRTDPLMACVRVLALAAIAIGVAVTMSDSAVEHSATVIAHAR